jgi:hypothetical protein
VENPWTTNDHGEELLLQTLVVDVLKTPIVVVVVVITKVFGTRFDFIPSFAVERHAHIVLGCNPRRDFNLERIKIEMNSFEFESWRDSFE